MNNTAKVRTSQFKISSGAGECSVQIEGTINENTDFSQIDLGDAKVVVLELGQVRGLNSMGLRNWVLWIRGLKNKSQMRFRTCPRVVVDQMNILQGFLPMGAVVESFVVPYTCQVCHHEENFVATRGKDFMEGTVDAQEGMNIPESKPCPACSGKMEWDVFPAKYFGFLKYRK